MDKIFWVAFEEEMEKLAGKEQLLGRLLKFLTKTKSRAAKAIGPHVSRLQTGFGQSAFGQWLSRHPRTSKALGFGVGQLGVGAAWSLGGIPFERRRKVVKLYPAPEEADYMLTQFRG